MAMDDKTYNQYNRALDSLDSAITKNSRTALKKIEKLILVAPNIDHEHLAAQVASCFDYLCEDKSPTAILKLFDKLAASGKAIDFAMSHGQLNELAATLTYALSHYLPDAVTSKHVQKSFDFIDQDHPLTNAMRESNNSNLINYLELLLEAFDQDEQHEPLPREYEAAKNYIMKVAATI